MKPLASSLASTASFAGHSTIDRAIFNRRPAAGIDVARVPDLVWLRGELDDGESEVEFVARAKTEARALGFTCIEVSGRLSTENEGDLR